MSKPRREGEGSQVGALAEIHAMVQALEADPSLRHRLPRPKPKTAEEARQMAELRLNMEAYKYGRAHHREAKAEAERRFMAAGGTAEAWAEINGIERATYHAIYAIYGDNAPTLDVPGFDRGLPGWLVRVGELAGKAYAAGSGAWYAFLQLTIHPTERIR